MTVKGKEPHLLVLMTPLRDDDVLDAHPLAVLLLMEREALEDLRRLVALQVVQPVLVDDARPFELLLALLELRERDEQVLVEVLLAVELQCVLVDLNRLDEVVRYEQALLRKVAVKRVFRSVASLNVKLARSLKPSSTVSC